MPPRKVVSVYGIINFCVNFIFFSPVNKERGGGDDFAWKQVAHPVLILIYF
jgi:hypothetical protein